MNFFPVVKNKRTARFSIRPGFFLIAWALLICATPVTWLHAAPSTNSGVMDLAGILDNQLVVDTNGDNIPDSIAARFLIDRKKMMESADMEGAMAIAARLGFESCAMDPSLCVDSWQQAQKENAGWLVVFAPWTAPKETTSSPGTTSSAGFSSSITIFRKRGMKVIEISGETAAARRYAAVNFFSRFPYMWDVTGRETGELWSKIKEDALTLLAPTKRKDIQVEIRKIDYRYQEPLAEDVKHRRLARLGLSGTMENKGEVENVEIEITLPKNSSTKELEDIFHGLVDDHKRGIHTNLFQYAGVNEVRVHIAGHTISIPRLAVPQRFLNPATDPFYFKKEAKIAPAQPGTDIAGFYSTAGIYKDTDNDGFADRLGSRLVYDKYLPQGTVELAARMGLEECVMSFPFTIQADELDENSVKDLERPIFAGNHNRFVEYLQKIGRVETPDLGKDEGYILFSPGFNPGGCYIITGSPGTGETAAMQFAAGTLPYISAGNRQPGAPVWEDVNREIELFFARKNDAGIAAWGVLQLDKLKRSLTADDLEKAGIELFTMRQVDGLSAFINERIGSWGNKSTTLPGKEKIKKEYNIQTGGRLEKGEEFTDSFAPRWEVEEAREIFTSKVVPQLQSLTAANKTKSPQQNAGKLFIDLRLSEPRDVLDVQAQWVKQQVLAAGFEPGQVEIRVLCAYKQGFHWLKDHVIPRLKKEIQTAPSKAVQAGDQLEIKIRFAPFPVELDREKGGKYRPEPVRWLQELYPVDEIIARELQIPLEAIQFVKDSSLIDAVYELEVCKPGGNIIYKEKFTPFTTRIPFQERFKQWGEVTASTSGIAVRWGDQEIFSTVFDTDPLRLWKHYQTVILPKLTKKIEKQAGGPLKLENQPFFHCLKVSVHMSEPDYRLGLDEELVSSLESFHEDLYFNTLDYFQGLIQKDRDMDVEDPLMAQRWAAPGNILPVIHPSRTGQGPLMETEASFLSSLETKVETKLHFQEEKKPVKIKKTVEPVKHPVPARLTCLVVDKAAHVKEAVYSMEFANEQELAGAVDMLQVLAQMQEKGILPQAFAYPGLTQLTFQFSAPGNLASRFVLPLTGFAAGQPVPPAVQLNIGAPHNAGAKASSPQLSKAFPWPPEAKNLNKVLTPPETLEIAKRLGQLAEIDTYIGGYSYQGRAVPVMEIGLKQGGQIVSLRKLTTYKPTIYILGRQHANEVSSTNYELYLAWLLAKNPGYRDYLRQLNIVIEPMENPDGSALAVELQKLTPYHMLHAGRYSALGSDIGYHVNKPDTLITEAKVRKQLFDRWQPDIFLNNHGYPSHEWVQQFSNYTPYLFRAYWVPRGWYYFHSGLNSISAPFHKKAGERIVEIISTKMKTDPGVFETNRRIYDRYRRWAERWQPHIHYLEIYDGTNIYKKRRGTRAARLNRRREMTVLEAVPEAMDETARDGWLQLSIRQGILFITSFMDLVLESQKPIERFEEESAGTVHLQVIRHRPIRPPH